MKIKKNFILKEIAGTYLVVAVGEAIKTFNSMINLNETGAFLWKKLEKDVSEQELVDALIAEYDVDVAIAQKDVALFVQRLKEANLLD